MGDVNLVRIFGDATNEIEEHKQAFMKKLLYFLNREEGGVYGVGDSCNAIKVFSPVDSNDSSMYLLDGGEVTEMDPCSDEFKRLMKENPGYIQRALEIMKGKIGRLEEMFAKSQRQKQKPKASPRRPERSNYIDGDFEEF